MAMMNNDDARAQVRAMLERSRIAEVYAATRDSLIGRVTEEGCVPESVGEHGYGPVEFCRTVGAMQALLCEIGEYALCERVIRFTLDSARRCGLNRIPHIAHKPAVDAHGNITQEFSTDDQADCTLHVLNAWARLAGSGKATAAFEEAYYDYVARLVNIVFDQPYFYYEPGVPSDLYPFMFPPESLKLVYNCALEHSRESRRWSAFDILTQSFAGATLEAMIPLAEKRGDTRNAAHWRQRMALLREGVDAHLTRELDGRKVYLEMRLPDGGWGRPFTGMGWLNFAPIAAGWEPLAPAVLDDTIAAIRRRIWRPAPFTDGKTYMATEFNEDGGVNEPILGKVIGWDIVYSLRGGDYAHILQWLEFLEEVNSTPLLAENLLPRDGKWHINDAGNGEQCAWWCWGMARLHAAVGLEQINKT